MQTKIYRYSLLKVFKDWWICFAIPIVLCGAFFVINISSVIKTLGITLFLVGSLPFILALLIPLIAIFVLLKTEIVLDEKEIKKRNFMKEKSIQWEDVEVLESVRKYSITSGKPKDLKITDKNGVTLFIYGFLKDFTEIEQEIERYSQKAIGLDKFYQGTGSVMHKKTFFIVQLLLGIALMIVLILSFFYDYDLMRIMKYFMPPTLILVFYLLYIERKSRVVLFFTDGGLKYVGAKQNGIRFEKFSLIIPWESISSAKLINDIKGPVKIQTSQGDYMFWSFYDCDLNFKVVEELNKRIS